MATYTSRYGLSKPENTDEMQSFMSDYADNMDKIDENLGGGGGSANIVELTQAEYDALPDTKLTDDTMYLIKDANSASDAEFTHVYGFYIDESNKLFEGTMTNFTQTLEYTATEDAIALVDYSGSSSTNQWFLINNVIVPFQMLSSGRDSFTVPIRKGDKISARHTSDNEGCYFHLVVYGVKTGSEVTFLSEYASACYSTTEREVGCWTDGKPIYQKTIVLTSGFSTNMTVSHDISNLERVVYVQGTLNNDIIPFTAMENNSFMGQWSSSITGMNASNFKIYIGSDLVQHVSQIAVTLRYTKTTDVAGSGQWTPMAQPTHHYSTTEQVVGTWIDGKPLYERTFDFNNQVIPDNTWSNNILGGNLPTIQIKSYDGYFGLENTDWTANFNYIRNNDGGFNEFFTSNSTGSDISVRPNMNAGVNVVLRTCTVRYTKTTD